MSRPSSSSAASVCVSADDEDAARVSNECVCVCVKTAITMHVQSDLLNLALFSLVAF